MAAPSLARSAQPSTAEPLPEYVLRGLGLFELNRETILAGYQGAGRWLVPSGTTAGKVYEVRAGTHPKRDRCECVGFQHHGHCSHLIAAHRAADLSAVCDHCGERSWWHQLTEVLEEHGLLSWYAGDLLCADCIAAGFFA